jgi:hypothetical protein
MSDIVPNPVVPPQKRLAVFLDGTWNTVNDNTNVWRLKSLLAPKGPDGVEQLSYYSTGVGTAFGERVRGGMFGYGLNDEIIRAYEWLIEHYNIGDELFIFGFSRGAYTARSLSGFISKCGLLAAGAPLSVDELYARYRRASAVRTIRDLLVEQKEGKSEFPLEERWILKYSQPSISTSWESGTQWARSACRSETSRSWEKADMQFLNTGIRISNKRAFHALAIDEHRKAFAPTLWTVDFPRGAPPPHHHRTLSQVEQRWFVGAHANVGGGCQSDPLAQAPLKWIMDKALLNGLAFRRDVEFDVLPTPPPISDSYGEFMHGAYKLLTLGQEFYREIGPDPVASSATELRENINETIDASVLERWRSDETYRPRNLARWAQRRNIGLDRLIGAVRADDPSTSI